MENGMGLTDRDTVNETVQTELTLGLQVTDRALLSDSCES